MGNNKKTFQGVVTGEIVSIDDPTFHGRVKIRIPGINDNVEVEKLPWVTYEGSSVSSGDGGGSISQNHVCASGPSGQVQILRTLYRRRLRKEGHRSFAKDLSSQKLQSRFAKGKGKGAGMPLLSDEAM